MTEQLADDSSIVINYMSISEEKAEEFKHLLLANIPLNTPTENKYNCTANSHVTEEGTTETFVIVDLYVSGDPQDILIALDDIKNGSLYETMDMDHKLSTESIHSHMMFNTELEVFSSISYLHNKGQYSANEISFLQKDLDDLHDIVKSQTDIIKLLTDKYNALQAYIHMHIDLGKLKSVVVELAEKVDKDILGSFSVIQVH